MKKLSIIIPVYNAEKYLDNTLRCVQNQDYDNFECLLINDGSTDKSEAICLKYCVDERFKFFSKENSGPSKTRNFGIDNCVGDYIAFLDADDMISKSMYSILIRGLEAQNADISACKYKKISSFTEVDEVIPNKIEYIYYKNEEMYLSMVRDDDSIEGYIWNKVWKREIIGNLRFAEDIYMCEDSLFTWKVLKTCKSVCYVDIPLYFYLIQNYSTTRSAPFYKQKTALISIETMLLDAKKMNKGIETDLAKQFLWWNLSVFNSYVKENRKSRNDYLKIRNNISEYYHFKDMVSLKPRILMFFILLGYQPARMVFKFKELIKRKESHD